LADVAQKIPSFSASKSLSGQSLTEFRNYVAQAKKLGLVPASTDARTARPYYIRGGKTLAETLNKNKSKLKPFTPAQKGRPKLLPPDKPILIRDLPLKAKSLAAAIKELESDPSKFDSMKKPGEKFAFQVGPEGYGSAQVFSDIELMTDYLRHYDGVGDREANNVFNRPSKSRRLFPTFKLIRWTQSNAKWKEEREKRVHKARTQRPRRKRRK
jgi:hypothetical protein